MHYLQNIEPGSGGYFDCFWLSDLQKSWFAQDFGSKSALARGGQENSDVIYAYDFIRIHIRINRIVFVVYIPISLNPNPWQQKLSGLPSSSSPDVTFDSKMKHGPGGIFAKQGRFEINIIIIRSLLIFAFMS